MMTMMLAGWMMTAATTTDEQSTTPSFAALLPKPPPLLPFACTGVSGLQAAVFPIGNAWEEFLLRGCMWYLCSSSDTGFTGGAIVLFVLLPSAKIGYACRTK
jgi:hypothetical protein